jgi:hypothetical protein
MGEEVLEEQRAKEKVSILHWVVELWAKTHEP